VRDKLTRLVSPRFLWLYVPSVITAIFIACGPSAPFPKTDPPPTFAIHYTLEATSQILVPAFTGSTLEGFYEGVPIANNGYIPSGYAKSFGPASVTFGSYYIVQGGFWPGLWTFSSIAGCGAGTSQMHFPVAWKIAELACVPRLLDPGVSPTSYNTQTQDISTLTITFSPAVPSGNVATYRFVDGGTGTVHVQQQITFNGSSILQVDAPMSVPNGGHYLTFDFEDNGYRPSGYEAMYAYVTTTGACTHGC
jgi:hypothetical protein